MLDRKKRLVGRKAILLLDECGRIPASVLNAADSQHFEKLDRLMDDLTISEVIRSSGYGERCSNDWECFSFEGLERPLNYRKTIFTPCFFPSSYFQIEVTPNHPLTEIFADKDV